PLRRRGTAPERTQQPRPRPRHLRTTPGSQDHGAGTMTGRGSQDGSPFDPVLLDLTDTEDYATVVHALEAYASDQDWEAEEEQERIRSNNLPDSESDEEHYLRNAARARRIA